MSEEYMQLSDHVTEALDECFRKVFKAASIGTPLCKHKLSQWCVSMESDVYGSFQNFLVEDQAEKNRIRRRDQKILSKAKRMCSQLMIKFEPDTDDQ